MGFMNFGSFALARRATLFALAGVVAFTAFGCSGNGVTDGATGQSEDALDVNEQPAFDYFVGKGLTPFQAAGIVGNLVQESNVSPTSVQPGGPGRGIAQWSVGGRWDHDANDNVVSYAAGKGDSATSLALQLDFIWYELTTFGYGYNALRATTNITDATVIFQQDFEGCGTCDETNRINYAKAALAAYGAIPYGASYVAQSFPLASTALKMKAGQVIPSFIELKNTGTNAWDSKTKIGTTGPRDRASAFADATWESPSRASAVTGTVAPGATYKFQFDLRAPSKPGTYDEFFGVVQEGVAWFGDPGEGGPVDQNIEVKIEVSPADGSDAGVESDGGAGAGDPPIGSDGGSESSAGNGGSPNADAQNGGQAGGCAVTASSKSSRGATGFGMLIAIGMVLAARRRRAI